MSRLGHRALIRPASLDIGQPLPDIVPAPRASRLFRGMQAEFEDELHAEGHHGVRGRDGVADEVAGVAFLDLRVQPVEVGPGVDRQSLQHRGRGVWRGATDVEGDEAVDEEGRFGGVHVQKRFRVLGSGGGKEVMEGVVGRDKIPGRRHAGVNSSPGAEWCGESNAGIGGGGRTYCVIAPLSCRIRSPSTRTGALPMLPPQASLNAMGAAMLCSRS